MKSNAKHSVGAVIVCAGKGERVGLAYNKILYVLGGKTVLERTLDVFALCDVIKTVVVASPVDYARIVELTAGYGNVTVCLGGDTRAKSVAAGLRALDSVDIVVIHDGARPFVTPEIIERSVKSAELYGSGIAATPSVDSVKTVKGGIITSSLDRGVLYNMQTPQTFRFSEISDAYSDPPPCATDDAEVYAAAGYTPHIVDGSFDNIKITNPSDLTKSLPHSSRVGIGYDVHRLVEGRKLILGGTDIPYELGLLGHSDADVLTHAVMDAMLSAAGLPDIGVLFPDTDDKFLGASSISLLNDVHARIKGAGYSIGNISAVVIAQKPKLAAYIPEIRASLCKALDISLDKINVSATTTEKLGVIGRAEAIAANAACILEEKK